MSLSVLDQLGCNPYSNISTARSEVVANAWDADADADADAERVETAIDADFRMISANNDGFAMTPTDLNDHSLYVGFQRPKAGPIRNAA